MSRYGDFERSIRQLLLKADMAAPLAYYRKTEAFQSRHDPVVILRRNLAHEGLFTFCLGPSLGKLMKCQFVFARIRKSNTGVKRRLRHLWPRSQTSSPSSPLFPNHPIGQ